MIAPLDYRSGPTRPAWTEAHFYLLLIKAMAGYFVVSILTLPFLDSLWIGRLPVIALVQLPKTGFAWWLIRHVAMPGIRLLGLSRGSASPDYIMVKPCALVAAYVLPLGLLLLIVWVRTRMVRPLWIWALLLLTAAITDFWLTLAFKDRSGFNVY